VANNGGPVLAAPVLTSITFPTYDLTSQVDSFISTVGSSAYWGQATREYGIGPATATAPVHLTEVAPTTIDDSAVQTWLAGKLDGTHAEFGTPVADSLYVIFYPRTTTVTLMGQTSCQQMFGYHDGIKLTAGPWAGHDVAYAVVPECNAGGVGMLATATQTASHELAEAVTDPFPTSANPGPTWIGVAAGSVVWELVLGGAEVGDMCSQFPDSYFTPPGFPYAVQRIWSNASGAMSHDPCQPSLPGEVYFNAAPAQSDFVHILFNGQPLTTYGIKIPLGQSRMVEVDLYSDAPLAPWRVAALDIAGGPLLNLSWDTTMGQNGDKLHLTITPVKADAQTGGEPFLVASKSGTVTHYWMGYVAQN
jgi:hypothetical protein